MPTSTARNTLRRRRSTRAPAVRLAAREQRAERQVHDGRQHRMAARKTARVYDLTVRARGPARGRSKPELQQHADERAAPRPPPADTAPNAPLALQREKPGRGQREQREEAGAAEAGSVAREILYPRRSQRIARLGRRCGARATTARRRLAVSPSSTSSAISRNNQTPPRGEQQRRERARRSRARTHASKSHLCCSWVRVFQQPRSERDTATPPCSLLRTPTIVPSEVSSPAKLHGCQFGSSNRNASSSMRDRPQRLADLARARCRSADRPRASSDFSRNASSISGSSVRIGGRPTNRPTSAAAISARHSTGSSRSGHRVVALVPVGAHVVRHDRVVLVARVFRHEVRSRRGASGNAP